MPANRHFHERGANELPSLVDRSREKMMHRRSVDALLAGSAHDRARVKSENEVFAFAAESVEIDLGSARRQV